MPYLTCTMISSVDLAQYGISHAKDWISVDCGTRWSVKSLNIGTERSELPVQTQTGPEIAVWATRSPLPGYLFNPFLPGNPFKCHRQTV